MPRPEVVFRAAMDDDDSQDEIIFVPYTKPAPVVIDILDSDDSANGKDDASKRSPKKKSKKKKSKRDRERSNSSSRIDKTKPSVSPPTPNENRSQEVIGLSDDGDIEEIAYDQVVAPTSSKKDNGAENVVAQASISFSKASVDVAPSRNILDEHAASTSSRSGEEMSSEGHIIPSEVINGKEPEPESGKNPIETTPVQSQNKVRGTSTKSKERNPRGEGKSRTRTLSATQRTNEEIVNFLTTLGIQMEPSAFEATPVTRRRQTRKRPAQPQVNPSEEVISPPIPAPLNNDNNGQTPSTSKGTPSRAFVSVTHEINPASTSKGKRRRQAVNGDISDYTISFTNTDLNAINTNFQSNVLMPGSGSANRFDGNKDIATNSVKANLMRQSYYAEVIDAVAKGLDSAASLTSTDENSLVINSAESNETSVIKPDSRTEQQDVLDFTKQNVEAHVKDKRDKDTKSAAEDKDAFVASNSTCQRNIDVPLEMDGSKSSSSTPAVCDAQNKVETNEKSLEVQNDPSLPPITSLEEVPNLTLASKTSEIRNPCSSQSLDICSNSSIVTAKSKTDENEVNSVNRTTKRLRESVENTPGGIDEEKCSRQSPAKKRHRTDFPSTVVNSKAAAMSSDSQSSTYSRNTLHQNDNTVTTASTAANHLPPESYFPTTWSGHMRDFYGSTMDENFELGDVFVTLSDSNKLWKANKDLMPPPKSKWRRVRCERCKQLGHLIRDCTEKKKPLTCNCCGKTGHTSDNLAHSRYNRGCPEAKCLNCGHKMSRYVQQCHKCLLHNRPPRCEICRVDGHCKELCPDNWRRYHSVTSQDDYEKITINKDSHNSDHRKKDSKVYKRDANLYCSNCGRRGHSYYDCRTSKYNIYPRNKPFIVREVLEPRACVASTSRETGIPISYDARTGRTVVVNSEAENQPALTVETIQVKITNELAFQNEESNPPATRPQHALGPNNSSNINSMANTSLSKSSNVLRKNTDNQCENKNCKNKLRRNEKCYTTVLEARAHVKLYRDQKKGTLKLLEEKHNVQISVLNDGCKVHIHGCSASVFAVDLEISDICRQILPATKIHPAPISSVETLSGTGIHTLVAADNHKQDRVGQPSLVHDANAATCIPKSSDSISIIDLVEADEDDEECLVIAEIAAKQPSNRSNPVNTVPGANLSNASRSTSETSSPNVAQKESSQDDAVATDTGSARLETQNDASKSSWSDYVSPLAGLSMSFEESELALNENTSVESSSIISNASSGHSNSQNKNYELKIPSAATSINQSVNNENAKIAATEDMDFNDIEEIDYSQFLPTGGAQREEVLQPKATNKIIDWEVQEVRQVESERSVEIITIDEEEPVSPPPAPPSQSTQEKDELSVCLMPSEWELTVTESAKQNSILKQIAEEFHVDIMVCKESSTVRIQNGNDQDRKMAKDEIVSWLESKCLNLEYHLVRRRVKTDCSPPKSKKSSISRLRALELNECNPQNQGKQGKALKPKRKPKQMNFITDDDKNSSSSGSRTSSNSSSAHSSRSVSPVVNPTLNFNKRSLKNSKNSPIFRVKRNPHSPSPKKMQQPRSRYRPSNNHSVRYPVVSSQAFNRTPRSRIRYFHD